MKKVAMRKYSLLGLVLIAASAVTAAVLPKNEDKSKVAANGILQASNGVTGAQLTCTNGGGGAQCTDTESVNTVDGVGSRTSTGGANTSTITTAAGVGVASTLTTSPRLAQTSA